MTDYMKEAERLIAEHEQAAGLCSYADCQTTRAALLAHIQRGAVPECDDGKRVLREVFALCEEMGRALDGVLAIRSDSQGVAGYHLNGEVASWDYFDEVATAETALAKWRESK